jgi:shikimate dehydrogenase
MANSERFLLAGVMGWPVMHSRSPKLHNHWFGKHCLAGTYVPLAVPPERLGSALRALPALGFSGCNLTIPHKEAAVALMDEIDAAASHIGAVNCVVARPDGRLRGLNTDAFGFLQAILERYPDWRADKGPAVVIGAGGASRAILWSLVDQGAREIRLVNRTPERAEQLARSFGPPVRTVAWAGRHDAVKDAALLVNATNQGMVGQPALALDVELLPRHATVCDIVYTPLQTPLLLAAQQRGCRIVDGLGMLLHQARPAWKEWFGIEPEVTSELRSLIEADL